jgi:hypothetical protein
MTETDWLNYSFELNTDLKALKRKCMQDYGSAVHCQHKQGRKRQKLGGFLDCLHLKGDTTPCTHKKIPKPTVSISFEGLHYARGCPTCDQSLCALRHIRQGWHTSFGELVEQVCPTCGRWDEGGIWQKTTQHENKGLHIRCEGGPFVNECCEHFHLPDCEHRKEWAEKEAKRKLEDAEFYNWYNGKI